MGEGCRLCGGPIRISEFRALACHHCGAESPLGPEAAQNLSALRELAGRRSATAEQWDRKLDELGGSFGSFELFGAILLWAVIGGTLIGMALVEVPNAETLFTSSVHLEHGVVFARWLVGSVASALCASSLFATAARWCGYQQMRFASALPPLSEGSAARCRRCGSPLPKGNGLRRCAYCQADSIVDKANLAALQATTKNELKTMRAAAQRSLLQREVVAVRLRNLLFVPPFALLILFPIFWFVEAEPPLPWLWIALACVPFCMLAFLVVPHRSRHKARA